MNRVHSRYLMSMELCVFWIIMAIFRWGNWGQSFTVPPSHGILLYVPQSRKPLQTFTLHSYGTLHLQLCLSLHFHHCLSLCLILHLWLCLHFQSLHLHLCLSPSPSPSLSVCLCLLHLTSHFYSQQGFKNCMGKMIKFKPVRHQRAWLLVSCTKSQNGVWIFTMDWVSWASPSTHCLF